ncbi:hypothetical protein ABK046_48595, partial [Streptomyces caeruleatus]
VTVTMAPPTGSPVVWLIICPNIEAGFGCKTAVTSVVCSDTIFALNVLVAKLGAVTVNPYDPGARFNIVNAPVLFAVRDLRSVPF